MASENTKGKDLIHHAKMHPMPFFQCHQEWQRPQWTAAVPMQELRQELHSRTDRRPRLCHSRRKRALVPSGRYHRPAHDLLFPAGTHFDLGTSQIPETHQDSLDCRCCRRCLSDLYRLVRRCPDPVGGTLVLGVQETSCSVCRRCTVRTGVCLLRSTAAQQRHMSLLWREKQ